MRRFQEADESIKSSFDFVLHGPPYHLPMRIIVAEGGAAGIAIDGEDGSGPGSPKLGHTEDRGALHFHGQRPALGIDIEAQIQNAAVKRVQSHHYPAMNGEARVLGLFKKGRRHFGIGKGGKFQGEKARSGALSANGTQRHYQVPISHVVLQGTRCSYPNEDSRAGADGLFGADGGAGRSHPRGHHAHRDPFPKTSVGMKFPVFREFLRMFEFFGDAGRPGRISGKEDPLRKGTNFHPQRGKEHPLNPNRIGQTCQAPKQLRRGKLPPVASKIAVIGGSGIYRLGLLSDAREVEKPTPYGFPSPGLALGRLGEIEVAFLPRHGRNHQLPPHRVPYRANIWALHELGVTRVIAISAMGGLRPHYQIGDLVLPDQFIDWTKGRLSTFFEGPTVVHTPMADPFCPELRAILGKSAEEMGLRIHKTGTVLVFEGPRFSTRAESRLYRDVFGADLLSMTLVPEIVLARELGMCYATVAVVTDLDVWGAEPVHHEAVTRVMEETLPKIGELLRTVIPRIPSERSCECGPKEGREK